MKFSGGTMFNLFTGGPKSGGVALNLSSIDPSKLLSIPKEYTGVTTPACAEEGNDCGLLDAAGIGGDDPLV